MFPKDSKGEDLRRPLAANLFDLTPKAKQFNISVDRQSAGIGAVKLNQTRQIDGFNQSFHQQDLTTQGGSIYTAAQPTPHATTYTNANISYVATDSIQAQEQLMTEGGKSVDVTPDRSVDDPSLLTQLNEFYKEKDPLDVTR